ncbi:MAG: M15 family metallopeptidase [Acidimicrobiales bacterium]|nr:M15 family metallopeptidase [Acidimicrobiales bacterium]MCB9372329.1 D-alanyl-D-alanine carboxypeptidase family protein [Microthrixaceae bacterium]
MSRPHPTPPPASTPSEPAERWYGGERGQALPLVLVALVVAGAALLLVGRLADGAAAAARARTAADAAALAGAAEGEGAARSVAAANDAELVTWAEAGARVRVEVSVDGRRAVAAAERISPPPATAGADGLTPEMRAAIARAEALLGAPVPIVSGWRSPAQQQWLWDHRATNPYPVARPGTSMHERGLAIDVPRWFVADLRSVAGAAGLCFPLPESDPVHFELCRPAPVP